MPNPENQIALGLEQQTWKRARTADQIGRFLRNLEVSFDQKVVDDSDLDLDVVV